MVGSTIWAPAGGLPTWWNLPSPSRHAARVTYENVYSGVDVTYYGNDGRLEYDFTLQRENLAN